MNEPSVKNSATGHYIMLFIFSAIALYKWYVYYIGYNYYEIKDSSEDILSIVLSFVVIVLLIYFIQLTKDKWAKRYLLLFLLFILLGHTFSHFGMMIFSIGSMPFVDAILSSLFCLYLAFFLYIFKKTGFIIFQKI